jgi:hypothetical protein
MKKVVVLVLSGLALVPFTSFAQTPFNSVFGKQYSANPNKKHHLPPPKAMEVLHRWNQIAIDATGLDHTPTAIGNPDVEPHVFGEQVGPARSSRAMAIIHIAMFEALNAIKGEYKGYTDVKASKGGAISDEAAIVQAAHDALVAMYPSQQAIFDARASEDLARMKNPSEKARGIALGKAAAAALLAKRGGDGSEVPEIKVGTGPNDYHVSNLIGHWNPDPISGSTAALGSHWGACAPFALNSGDQFRLPPPPDINSTAYLQAYNEVKRLGGVNSADRTDEQTLIGTFWGYDGTPSLCAPPRLYNQIAVLIADQRHVDKPIEFARFLALTNLAMADAGMASWDSKFAWDFWRPITAIRIADDGNGLTQQDPNFTPLGAPASNLVGPNFTPPFPSYPSGHATFGGAVFQVIRRFFGTDNIKFTLVSDEFNGETFPAGSSTARPLTPRSFKNLTQAESENAQSRIYLGIHWNFDATDGIALGRKVGDWAFDHVLQKNKGKEATATDVTQVTDVSADE